MKCLECGHDLIEMRRELLGFTVDTENHKQPWDLWKYSHTEYAGHCENCFCDWEWGESFDLEKELQDISLEYQKVNQVKEAEWIYDHWCEFKCSNCGNWSDSKPYKGMEKYCPECGTKMFKR